MVPRRGEIDEFFDVGCPVDPRAIGDSFQAKGGLNLARRADPLGFGPHPCHRRRVLVDFLERQASRYQGEPDDPRAWADLCHVLMNLKEFVFLD